MIDNELGTNTAPEVFGPPCAVCGEPLNYIPRPCCNQYDCPCRGQLDPEQTVCSEECFVKLTEKE